MQLFWKRGVQSLIASLSARLFISICFQIPNKSEALQVVFAEREGLQSIKCFPTFCGIGMFCNERVCCFSKSVLLSVSDVNAVLAVTSEQITKRAEIKYFCCVFVLRGVRRNVPSFHFVSGSTE